MIDPFTAALAVFGIQKLRGKSTSRAFRDSLLAAGGVQLAGMGGVGADFAGPDSQLFSAFGTKEGIGSLVPGFGASGTYLGGEGVFGQLAKTTAGQGISSLIGKSPMSPEAVGKLPEAQILAGGGKEQLLRGTGFLGADTGTKAIIGLSAAPVIGSLFQDEEEPVKPPFTEADYQAAYAKQPKLSLTGGTGSITRPVSSIYNYQPPNPMYYFNQGGIVSVLPKYAQGGINYLPSKVTHDENDVHNYVRATGYVEDGSGNGDKDEDTVLAQLADGEFVTRTDGVLGAGIIAGANPNNMKQMREKGAKYFYEQQARFKRVFDLLQQSKAEAA